MSERQDQESHTGGCLCGAVRYVVHGPLRQVVACHCSQCRRTSGHFAAVTATRREKLEIARDDGLAWYESSPGTHRGFCKLCGSSLFWAPADGSRFAVLAGTLDGPTGLSIAMNVFVDDAGDYYQVPQDAPHIAHGDHGIPVPEA